MSHLGRSRFRGVFAFALLRDQQHRREVARHFDLQLPIHWRQHDPVDQAADDLLCLHTGLWRAICLEEILDLLAIELRDPRVQQGWRLAVAR
ncbi:hypothetical protein [Sphingomonas sp. 22176]|uniref:hypothetical protein n=1 Tax=Sphingomonas sp. 22176 TaxID=3453884 RepID=UPI003F827310